MKHLVQFRSVLFLFSIIGVISVDSIDNAHAQKKKGHTKAHHKKKHHNNSHKKGHVKRYPHFHYEHLPRRGAVVSTVAKGHVGITHKGIKFKFHNGVYYQSKGPATFVVVRPPRGLKIMVMPVGYKRIVVKQKTYFYYYGTFYSKTPGMEEYTVTEAPVGAEVDALPEGYEITTVDGVEYYTLDDAKYQSVEKEDGEVMYQVVASE